MGIEYIVRDIDSHPTQGDPMNIVRMFAFVAAVLITAVLFRVIADGLTDRDGLADGQGLSIATEAVSTDHQQTTGD
jgi:hypothetical protein